MKTKLLTILTLLIIAASSAIMAAFPPNPNIGNPGNYISDPTHLLSPQTAAEANRLLQDCRNQTSAEVAVAIVDQLGDMSIEEYASSLFAEWGLGKRDRDNGVLIVISTGARQARIEVGYGAEGIITDALASGIIRHEIIPAMKNGDIDQAVAGSVRQITATLEKPEYAEELRSRYADGQRPMETIDSEIIWNMILLVAGCTFLISLFIFISTFPKTRKRNNYEKSAIWRKRLPGLWICSALSLGASIVFALVAFLLYRHYRRKPLRCDTCGAKMHKLSEEEDNLLLSESQDLEERLDTVDYDVWECPQCGTVERVPFPKRQTKYTPCPACGTIANHLVCDKITVPATTSRPGHGEKIYKCEYCHNQTRLPYVIPKKDDGALLAAAALGAMAGSRNHGGGFGGGFGGGSSGGGGASGGW